jgi:hypothetical protein
MRAAWKLAQRWFGWIAATATAVGVVIAVRSQWDAIVSLDWGRSWGVTVLAALAFAVPPLVQAAAFWVSLRLLGVRAPVPETALVWGRAFVVRYAPSGALSVVYRVRERERLGATREQVLLATAYEHLGSLAAGALVCLSSFLLAGGAPPLLGLAIALPVAALAIATRPRFSAPLMRRLASHLGLEEPPLLRGRQLAAVVGINTVGWLGTAGAVHLLVAGLAPGSPPSVAWLTGTYAVGYLVGFVVPFLPGGLGAREGALAAVYAARFGAAVATALVLTIRLVTTLGEVVAVGLIELAWLVVRMRRRRRILTGSCRRSAPRPVFSGFSAASASSRRARWPEAHRARPAP